MFILFCRSKKPRAQSGENMFRSRGKSDVLGSAGLARDDKQAIQGYKQRSVLKENDVEAKNDPPSPRKSVRPPDSFYTRILLSYIIIGRLIGYGVEGCYRMGGSVRNKVSCCPVWY